MSVQCLSPFTVRMRRSCDEENKVLRVASLVARNENSAMMRSGAVCVWQEAGVRRSVVLGRVAEI